MKLYEKLGQKDLKDEEKWRILNKLEKEILGRRLANGIASVAAPTLLMLNLILTVYLLPLAFFWEIDEFAAAAQQIGLVVLQPMVSFFQGFVREWYVTVLLVVAFVFAVPTVVAIALKFITQGLYALLAKEKTAPLPQGDIAAIKALVDRSDKLHRKQYDSVGVDVGSKPALFGALTFVVVGLAACWYFGLFEQIIYLPPMLIAMAIGGGILWFFSLVVLLWQEKLMFLFFFPKWHPRSKALKEAELAFDERWVTIDAQERNRREEIRRAQEAAAAENTKSAGSYFAGLPQYEQAKAEARAYLRGEAPPAPKRNPADDWIVVPHIDVSDI